MGKHSAKRELKRKAHKNFASLKNNAANWSDEGVVFSEASGKYVVRIKNYQGKVGSHSQHKDPEVAQAKFDELIKKRNEK